MGGMGIQDTKGPADNTTASMLPGGPGGGEGGRYNEGWQERAHSKGGSEEYSGLI